MILSYAYPTPRKKISVASLQLGTSADLGHQLIQGIDVLNVVLPEINSKFIARGSTLGVNFCPIALVFLVH